MVLEHSSHSTSSLSSLTCQEVVDEDTFINLTNYNISSNTEEEHQYVQMLLEREISADYKSSYMIGDWIKCARLDAITWILKTRALFGFRFQTAFLSVNYFDRFLSKRVIENEKHWAIRLLSVACLSLAAKMEEECTVPALSEFPGEDNRFESKVIQRMELLVLNTLEWKMGSVTPYAYVHYFITSITKLCKDRPPRNIVSRTVELILAIMRDVNFKDYRPSVIAVAAALVALDQKLTRQTLESKINALSFNGLLEIVSSL
ncbi:cyclin-D5-2-like [Cornus florida]|uniref:cyclin-D5-2-like n=1 Tax=Cornus florida TaxID=4283 RepID=UPI0028A056C8|nr:cyclin-D5-2-like [Cornus florida]